MMRQILRMLSLLAVVGINWIDPPNLAAQQECKSQPGYQWSNSATYGPGWQSQYPLGALTTQRRPSISSTFPFGINTTSGLTSNGENLLVAEGELTRVDRTGQRLWIRTPQEIEQVFHYTCATQILGASAKVEGLAPTRNSRLRVLYTREGGRDSAVHIEVERNGTRSQSP